MSLTDPLGEYELGPAESADELIDRITARDGERIRTWRRGGQPVALTQEAIFFIDDGAAYRIPRGKIRAFGLTRSSNKRLLRWGLAFYLLAMIPLFFTRGILILLGIAMALAGGVLVVSGFLQKAILIQLTDERIPPLVVENRKWRSLRSTFQEWR